MNSGFQCTGCGDKYSGAFNFYRHLKFNHTKIKGNYNHDVKCQMCNSRFSKHYYLKKHISKVHPKSIRTCHLCEKVLKSRAFLYTHYKNDHPLQNCPVEIDEIHVFKCHYCEQVFASLTANFTHLKLKHKERKSFKEIHNLMEEKIRKIQDVNRDVMCQICNAKFSRNHYLKIHISKVHVPKTQSEEN